MGQESDPTLNNEIGIKDDELGQEIMKEHIEHLEKEIEMFKQNLIDLEKSKTNFKEQWDVDNRIYEIFLNEDSIRTIEPKYKYELTDEYWELRKKQLFYKYRSDKFMAEAKLKEFDRNYESVTEQLKSSEEQLKEVLGEKDDRQE